MHPVSGYNHFSKWNAKRQESCIRACGLAYRQYRNKPARNDVLSKLLNHDLPLDPEAVKLELGRLDIPITTRFATKLSLQLLNKMSGTVSEPAAAAVNNACRQIGSLSAIKLAEKARELVEKLMFLPTDSDVTDAMRQLWKDRCKVTCSHHCFFLFYL